MADSSEKASSPPASSALHGQNQNPPSPPRENEASPGDMCRYCLGTREEGDGDLISPCNCKGGQKWVHLHCLRRWQRMVLVSQPTHPSFYRDDERHHVCNVCKSKFMCTPPTRQELMESFTGAEIAALIEKNRIIGNHKRAAEEMRREMAQLPPIIARACGHEHWIEASLLITDIEVDDIMQSIEIDSEGFRDAVYERLENEEGVLRLGGRSFRLAALDCLEGVAEDMLIETLRTVEVPCTLTMKADEEPSCGNDTIRAVNITRRTDNPVQLAYVTELRTRIASQYADASACFENYIGGPCDESNIQWAIVAGGSAGWTVLKSAEKAFLLSMVRAQKVRDGIAPGQPVKVTGLKSREDLNGERGIALSFSASSGRWNVRLRSGDGKKIKRENLEVVGRFPPVMLFWGDARWSRTQLLGEIAKGHWGMTKGDVSDFIAPPDERWTNLEGRMVFSPITEMSEEYIREAQNEMMTLTRSRMRNDSEGSVDANELAIVESE